MPNNDKALGMLKKAPCTMKEMSSNITNGLFKPSVKKHNAEIKPKSNKPKK